MTGISNITQAMVNITPSSVELGSKSAVIHQGTNGATFAFELPEPIRAQGVADAASPLQSTIMEPTNWSQMAGRMMSDVNDAQATAGAMVRDVLAGGPTQVHEAMIAVQESGMKFQMLAEIKNKFLEAYQEVMRMQV